MLKFDVQYMFYVVCCASSCVVGEMSHPQDQGALYIDRDGIPRWNGEPKFGEEWEERKWLAFDCCTGKDFKLAFPSRLRNGLTGRAWEMTKA